MFLVDNWKNPVHAHWAGSFPLEVCFMPPNAEKLSLPIALNVVFAAAKQLNIVKPGETLSLSLGIDEYQAIPEGPNYDPNADDKTKEQTKTYLWKLLAAFASPDRTPGIHLYPGFAGTKWGTLGLANSSVARVERVPLLLLPPQHMEDVIASNEQYHVHTSKHVI